jgi:iron uptake system component EfeO
MYEVVKVIFKIKESASGPASVLALACVLGGCDQPTPEHASLAHVQASLDATLDDVALQLLDLQAAAPDGPWAAGEPSLTTMKTCWSRAHVAYEGVQGALDVLFSDVETTFDTTYTDYLQKNPGDDDPFDDEQFVGAHAIERILWSADQPQPVIDFEFEFDHYTVARYPATADEAQAFKQKLVRRAIDDIRSIQMALAATTLDEASAYHALAGPLPDQLDKVLIASTPEEESRYSQTTLADLRGNLAGERTALGALTPWIDAAGGGALVTKLGARLDAIQMTYDATMGDALPPVPDMFDPNVPTTDQLATPFGQIYGLLQQENDPDHDGSTVALTSQVADLLKIPQLPQ